MYKKPKALHYLSYPELDWDEIQKNTNAYTNTHMSVNIENKHNIF